ncbi:hypothetical protein [Crocosphaera chwakensis]|uniref:Uncharacterized protein n=1 Tax=Crocosphaera chwakensis CCY0110 TaxID=391612 RepID=A3IRE3_9CHRO|nr:hypothetical protein [Crocosphaera chwakensis]EAZ90945.1 hypothetical protein CY0110_21195 [Crocosphaera chwakensis CCY0110]
MKVSWKKLFLQTSIWIASEILLNLIGLDNLADYSEFIFKQKETIFMTTVIAYLVVS